MDFSDEGILISAKPLGEANAIAELLTAGMDAISGWCGEGGRAGCGLCCSSAIA